MRATIDIKIASENVENVVNYLLSTQTPFVLEFSQPLKNVVLDKKPTYHSNNVTPTPPKTTTQQKSASLTELIETYFSENVATPLPKIEEIAQVLGISVHTLQSKTKEFFGKSVYQFSVEKRMEVATQLLRQGYKACEVSKMVGYGDRSAIKFNKMFQKHFGMTPKKFQKDNF